MVIAVEVTKVKIQKRVSQRDDGGHEKDCEACKTQFFHGRLISALLGRLGFSQLFCLTEYLRLWSLTKGPPSTFKESLGDKLTLLRSFFRLMEILFSHFSHTCYSATLIGWCACFSWQHTMTTLVSLATMSCSDPTTGLCQPKVWIHEHGGGTPFGGEPFTDEVQD